jgi:hypothetical protein
VIQRTSAPTLADLYELAARNAETLREIRALVDAQEIELARLRGAYVPAPRPAAAPGDVIALDAYRDHRVIREVTA